VGGPGPAAEHKVVYHYRTLTEVFSSVGVEVRLLEWCDEQGRFHWEDWDLHSGRYCTRPIHSSRSVAAVG